MKSKTNKKIRIWLLLAAILVLLAGACALYAADYYRADTAAIAAFTATLPAEKTVLYDGAVAYGPADAQIGFIFYPGGKVEYTAYEPLLRRLASDGILCILLRMPLNLAVLDSDAADDVLPLYPNVQEWYVGGHSLGGAMAASYAESHKDVLTGVVLLGAYSTKDLTGTTLRVLSVYGSEDGVMNREKYDACKGNLPADFSEVILEGGCHAYFGMYGSQDGDGIPSLSADRQITETADCIKAFFQKGDE